MRTRQQSLLSGWVEVFGARRPRPGCAAAAALAAALGLGLATPSVAHAQQLIERFALRAELGVGTMFSDYQRNTSAQQYSGNALGYDNLNFHIHVRAAFTIVGPLVVQASFSNGFFPTSTREGTGRVMAFEGGLRFEPRVGRVGRLFFDGNAGYALTGPYERFEFNGAVGFEFNILPALAAGPVFRVTDVFQPAPNPPRSVQYPYDAIFWQAGISVTGRVPPELRVLDSDCDTVPDPEDMCVSLPQGGRPDPRRPGCPAADSDNDYVLDPDDRCPTEREGDYPDPRRMGCPDPDRDHDGVANEGDGCPQTPQGDIPDPQRAGCPHPNPQAVLSAGQIRINRQIHFDTDQANVDMSDPNLTRENHEVLDQVVLILRAHPEIEIDVQGYTDNRCDGCQDGRYQHNLNLSRRRAEAIQQYLVGHNVAPGRISSHGYGEARPIGDNRTEEGRQRNRRVEFRILNQDFRVPEPLPDVTPHPRQRPPAPVPPSQPCVVTTRG